MDDSRFTIGQLACEKIPFLLLTAADGIATIYAQHGAHAIMSGQVLDVRSRMGNALISYASYLGQMIYPAGLVVLYPHPGDRLSVWRVGLSLPPPPPPPPPPRPARAPPPAFRRAPQRRAWTLAWRSVLPL